MLKVALRKDHNALVAMLQASVERGSGVKVQKIELFGLKKDVNDKGLKLSCSLTVKTRQGDIGHAELTHDEIRVWIEASLTKDGYSKLVHEYVFHGTPITGRSERNAKRFGDLVMTFWIDVHDPDNNRDVL